VQPVGKRLAARRASAGLAIANSSECNNADDRFPAGLKGVTHIDQCGVAALGKGTTFPCGLRLALADVGSSEPQFIIFKKY